MKIPQGSTLNHQRALPLNGGYLVLEDADGIELDRWVLAPIVDDFNNPIPGAKYQIAAAPVAIPDAPDTHR